MAEYAPCALHGKSRAVTCLVAVGPGEFHCAPGSECRTSAPVLLLQTIPLSPNVVCRAHGKLRTVGHVAEVEPGVYECQEGSECKGVFRPAALCSRHGKPRRLEHLQEVAPGPTGPQYECVAGFECKTGGAPGGDAEVQPQVGTKRPLGVVALAGQLAKRSPQEIAGGTERVLCATHGKLRLAICLQVDPAGNHRCTPEAECRAGPTVGPAPVAPALPVPFPYFAGPSTGYPAPWGPPAPPRQWPTAPVRSPNPLLGGFRWVPPIPQRPASQSSPLARPGMPQSRLRSPAINARYGFPGA